MKKEPLKLEESTSGDTTTAFVMKTVSGKSLVIRQYWPKVSTDVVYLDKKELQAIVDYARANGIKVK